MAKSSSPLSVRVSDEERRVLEVVAAHLGSSVSEFVRRMAVDGAMAIVHDQGGVQKIRQGIDERNDRLNEDQRRSLEAVARLQSSSPRT